MKILYCIKENNEGMTYNRIVDVKPDNYEFTKAVNEAIANDKMALINKDLTETQLIGWISLNKYCVSDSGTIVLSPADARYSEAREYGDLKAYGETK